MCDFVLPVSVRECRVLIRGNALCASYPMQERMERKLCLSQALRLPTDGKSVLVFDKDDKKHSGSRD